MVAASFGRAQHKRRRSSLHRLCLLVNFASGGQTCYADAPLQEGFADYGRGLLVCQEGEDRTGLQHAQYDRQDRWDH
jgi:hypothetical protein